MKVFFDTNILIDATARVDKYPHSMKVINEVIQCSMLSQWVSSLCLNNIHYILSRLRDETKAYQALSFIREYFSIIPFRRSGFEKAMQEKYPDFEDRIQMSCAEEMGMDCIITRNFSHFQDTKIVVLSPTQFLERLDAGGLQTFDKVPFMDLRAQYHEVYNEIDDKITDVISRSAFILGNYVQEFEQEFARAQEARYCIGVSSGTDALHQCTL